MQPLLPRLLLLTSTMTVIFAACFLGGLASGSSGFNLGETWNLLWHPGQGDATAATILFEIRLPRVTLAAVAGATLALGGLVFQALLRNPLAEPYILGISGGSAIGAILGMLAGLSTFPGVPLAAFAGSMMTLALIMIPMAGRLALSSESLLLGGVMVNAFCGAVIMLLISLTRSSQVQHILFWLMGDLSRLTPAGMPVLAVVLPCFLVIFLLARPMNLLLLGQETATSLGINARGVTMALLLATSFMVSLVVCQCGLIGFVGLVVPHVLRLLVGPDHRLLVPASLLGGGAFLILCDLLARTIPVDGDMPVGIVTALIGAPLFLFLLWRSGK
jgi:iron complex transport system permease protein